MPSVIYQIAQVAMLLCQGAVTVLAIRRSIENPAWVLFATAFGLMVFRRATAISMGVPGDPGAGLDRLALPGAISILLLAGMIVVSRGPSAWERIRDDLNKS